MALLSLISVARAAAAGAATPEAPSAPAGAALTLAQAEAQALARQPAVLQARGQVEAAEGRVVQARAGYLPQLLATGLYQRTTGNYTPRPGISPGTASVPSMAPITGWSATTYNYFNFGATATQLIYDFGQTDGRWRAAAAGRDSVRAGEATTRAQALLAVRQAYFQAGGTGELVAVAEQTVGNQERHLAQTQGFVRAGMRPEIDLARVRTDLANARVQLVTARNNAALALAELDRAMGQPAGTTRKLGDAALPPVSGEDDRSGRLVDEALAARPETMSLEAQRRSAELSVRALKGAYGPALGAAAGASLNGTAIDHLAPNAYVGLTLTWSILQGGLTTGQVREAEGNLAAVTAQGEALRLQVRVDVESAQLAVIGARASIVAATEALANAREQLRLAERRYETGLGSAIELGDAQVALTGAAAQDVSARYGLSLARAQLMAAVGTR